MNIQESARPMSGVADPTAIDGSIAKAPQANVGRRLLRNGGVVAGAAILAIMLAIALAAPWLGTVDPAAINPAVRNKLPGFEETLRGPDGAESTLVHRLGTDTLGRDVYSRVAYGARASRHPHRFPSPRTCARTPTAD